MATPGSTVPVNAIVTPGGATGATGQTGMTMTTVTQQFTVPAVGSTVVVNVADASRLLVGEMVYIDSAAGSGQAGVLQVTQVTLPNQATLLNPQPPGLQLATTQSPGMLTQISGKTTDFVDGTNNCQPIAPQIYSVRLRSFNAIGNPTFEVDQINPATAGTWSATTASGKQRDRWWGAKSGSMVFTDQVMSGLVPVPGTSFYITQNFWRFTLTTQEATLAAGDYMQFYTYIEGPMLRELLGDVTSLQLLVRSSVANLSFGVTLGSVTGTTERYVMLATIPNANTWTLLTFPNIPIWPSGGTWPTGAGNAAYDLIICPAAGSTYIAAQNNAWISGANVFGAVGQSNWCASPVNSTLDIAFVQHEPGALCSQLIDKPFDLNLRECKRYYQKSYSYGVIYGSSGSLPIITRGLYVGSSTTVVRCSVGFEVEMAKAPTVRIWNPSNGVLNQIYLDGVSATEAITGPPTNNTTKGMGSLALSAAGPAAAYPAGFEYDADTGW